MGSRHGQADRLTAGIECQCGVQSRRHAARVRRNRRHRAALGSPMTLWPSGCRGGSPSVLHQCSSQRGRRCPSAYATPPRSCCLGEIRASTLGGSTPLPPAPAQSHRRIGAPGCRLPAASRPNHSDHEVHVAPVNGLVLRVSTCSTRFFRSIDSKPCQSAISRS
jgi:hypothetical protein